LFLLTLLGVSGAHLGVNLANDYFDYLSGADRHNADRPFSGGGDALRRDGVAPARVRRWFLTCFAVALAIGLYLLYKVEAGRGWILAIMLLGFAGGYYYTAPPLKLAYRGLGELDIFLFLGPAPVLGTYAVLTGTVTPRAFLLSMPIAGLIALLLWINQYTDVETDQAAGKRNLVVRLGRRRARWGYLALNVFVFAAVYLAVRWQAIGAPFLLVFLALPLSVRSVYRALRNCTDERWLRAAQGDALAFHLAAGLLCSVGAIVASFA
jgi:1,4-dihydroxy-2-naphthoate octaprenyltransferase